MNRYRVTTKAKSQKTVIDSINIDPREWIVRRKGQHYFGVERGPQSKAAFLAGDRTAVHTTLTFGFDKPSDACDALRLYLKQKGL